MSENLFIGNTSRKMSENLFIGNTEDKILKHKMIEELEASLRNESKNIITTSEADFENDKKVVMTESKLHKESKVIKPSIQSEDLLILRLGSDTNSTSNLLEKGEHSSSSQNVIAELLSDQEVKEFPCLFCNKKFSTSQALGGHQNAHKRERVLKKMEKKKIEEEMNSTLRYRPSFPYSYPYSGPIHYQAYPYLCGNLQVPVGTQMNNVMSSWLDSPSGSYREMYMPNTLSPPPTFMMQVPKPPHALSQLRMTNLLGGNQNPTLSVSQMPNNTELRLSSLTNQTPPSGEDAERNSNAQFPFQGLTIETRDLIRGSQLLTETNVSSSSTTESTSEEFDLNLKL